MTERSSRNQTCLGLLPLLKETLRLNLGQYLELSIREPENFPQKFAWKSLVKEAISHAEKLTLIL